MGRLSNPPEPLKTLTEQGVPGNRRSRQRRSKQPMHSPTSSESAVHKMSAHDVGEAAHHCRNGDSLATVALTFNVDAATVRRELHRAGVTIRC